MLHYWEILIPIWNTLYPHYEILVIMLGFHHYWKITFQCWDISNCTSTLSGNSDLMLGYFQLYAIIILENYDSKLGIFLTTCYHEIIKVKGYNYVANG